MTSFLLRQVAFVFYPVGRFRLFLLASFLETCHSKSLAQFCPFTTLLFFTESVILLRPCFGWSRSFLLIAKVFIPGTILQDGCAAREYSSPSAFRVCAQQCVHPTSGTLRVFKHFAQLEVGPDKMALSRPTHLRVTRAVGQQGSLSSLKCGQVCKTCCLLPVCPLHFSQPFSYWQCRFIGSYLVQSMWVLW